jgi:hypothetical protein
MSWADVNSTNCDESKTLFEIHAERSTKLFTVFVKLFHSKRHVVLQSTAPLQLKCFEVVSRMAIAASARQCGAEPGKKLYYKIA